MDSKLESVQYSAVLAITGAIKGTSKLKLCKELKRLSGVFIHFMKLCLLTFQLIFST